MKGNARNARSQKPVKRAGRQGCFLLLPFVLLTEELYAVEFPMSGHEYDIGFMKWAMMRHIIVKDVYLRLWWLAVAAGCMTLKTDVKAEL